MLRWRPHIRHAILCISAIVLVSAASPARANEVLRVAGMGGASAGLYSDEGSIFGNPAGLINVRDNNLSVALMARDVDYETLPLAADQQANTRVSFKLSPSIYYSRVIKGFGVGIGYVDNVNNNSSTLIIKTTEAEYIVDERKFSSYTDTILDYDYFRDQEAVIALGRALNPGLSVGLRMKYTNRVVKEGTIVNSMLLTAVHGEDVNRNDATKLLPAIIDNLNIGNAIDDFKEGKNSEEDVRADLSGSGLDMDIGIQAKLFEPGDVSVGFMLDHLIQRRVVRPQPSSLRLGVGAKPAGWFAAALDLQKELNDSGLNVNMGWEISYKWQRWFSGGITLRNGFAHDSSSDILPSGSKNKLSIGIGLVLGGSHWDYTLVKSLDDSPLNKAAHMFSSTTRF